MDKTPCNTLTDRHGHMEPDTKPLWHLGIVASSFVMLNESTEDTLYNMAQVANITQLVGHLRSTAGAHTFQRSEVHSFHTKNRKKINHIIFQFHPDTKRILKMSSEVAEQMLAVVIILV